MTQLVAVLGVGVVAPDTAVVGADDLGINRGDDRFGFMYDLGSKFSVNAWTSDDDSFIGGVYKYSF